MWRGTEPRLNLFLENPVSVRLPCLKREQTSTMCQGMPGESRGAIILDFTLRLWSVNTTPDCNAEAHLNNVGKTEGDRRMTRGETRAHFISRKKKKIPHSLWLCRGLLSTNDDDVLCFVFGQIVSETALLFFVNRAALCRRPVFSAQLPSFSFLFFLYVQKTTLMLGLAPRWNMEMRINVLTH